MGRYDLAGRRIVVTGASRGIGAAVCAGLAASGAEVILIGRLRESLDEVAATLPGGPHPVIPLDVTDEAEWTAAAERLAVEGPVHGLVTAAGDIGPIGPVGSWNIARFRRALDVNVIGTLLPIVALLGSLRAGAGAVVTYSGGGATGPFPRYDAYATSKAAVVRLTENLSSDLKGAGIRINSVAPGFVLTSIHDATLEAGSALAGPHFDRTRQARDRGEGDSPQLAADLTAFLLSDDSAGITGRLISARWDPWRDPEFQAQLRREPDLATLRRIDHQYFSTIVRRAP
jgi:3-oxoacyl-[acyl-carrier protein] reductase